MPFGHSYLEQVQKTRVSCLLITMVLTNVHITFPIPFISAPSDVLAYVCRHISRCDRACCRSFKQSVYPQLSTKQLPVMHLRLRSLCSKVVSVIETRHLERCRSIPVKGTPCLSKRTLQIFTCKCLIYTTNCTF